MLHIDAYITQRNPRRMIRYLYDVSDVIIYRKLTVILHKYYFY